MGAAGGPVGFGGRGDLGVLETPVPLTNLVAPLALVTAGPGGPLVTVIPVTPVAHMDLVALVAPVSLVLPMALVHRDTGEPGGPEDPAEPSGFWWPR